MVPYCTDHWELCCAVNAELSTSSPLNDTGYVCVYVIELYTLRGQKRPNAVPMHISYFTVATIVVWNH